MCRQWRRVPLPTHRPWLIACVACLALGGWLGWRVRGEPPKPNVVKVHKENDESRDKTSASASSAVEVSSVQVTPPTSVKRKRTLYHPPVVSCAPADKPCVCPGPGPIAEVDETDTATGQGVLATNAKSASASEQQADNHRRTENEGVQHDTYAEWPRLTLSLGAAVSPLADEKRPAPALGATLRIFENYNVQAVAESQLDFEELRIVALFGLPIW